MSNAEGLFSAPNGGGGVLGNIINREGCAGKCGVTFIIERTPFPWGGVRGVAHGVKGVSRGVKGWGRKLPHGVNGVKNSEVG